MSNRNSCRLRLMRISKVFFVVGILILSSILFVSNAIATNPPPIKYREGIHLNFNIRESDDPDYPLGSRWIALEGISGEAKGRSGFAIHGTKIPEEIGTAGSRGCIRLYNSDAILVYNLLTPGLSRVEVVD